MEKEDLFDDKFLRDLIQRTPLEEPSDDFVGKVMVHIQPEFEVAPSKKPFFLFLRSTWLYVVLSVAVIGFLLTSDLPFTNILPGKDYFVHTLLPYFSMIFSNFRNMAENSKFMNIGLMVVAAGGLVFLFDLLITKRSHTQHHITS